QEMKLEVHRIDSVYSRNGTDCGWEDYDPNRDIRGMKELATKSTQKFAEWVLLLKRQFRRDGRYSLTEMEVKSPLIKEVLKEACDERAMDTAGATIPWPNDKVFRYRGRIREAAKKKSELAEKHCAVLLDYLLLEKNFAEKIRDIDDMFPKEVCTFNIARELFFKDDLIFTKADGELRMFRVADEPQYVFGIIPSLVIPVYYIDYDGQKFGHVKTQLSISTFDDVQFIRDLPVVPMKYLVGRKDIETSLVARGKRFTELAGQNYRSYCGVAGGLYIDSRVMIDTKTYNRRVSTSKPIAVTALSKKDINRKTLTRNELLICTPWIPFFSFADKQFVVGKVDKVTEIVWNDNSFANLVLPDSQKELVRILVENHVSEQETFDDFVKGKGKGLICVLHGPPGVGKTMTAESVAEHTKRPLYMITSGELGSSPEKLEAELTKVLELCKTWNAVLLLDEADVFMEQRTSTDVVRNCLVSIFLRLLEYYQGILFLTTNRVGSFDEAFHSRIHIALHYRNLTSEARERIWRNFSGLLGDDKVELSDEDYKELSKIVLNGRQIKNTFRTAKALSSEKGDKIRMQHLRIVLGVMSS
ncbi:P-loop containing nucleoside triphosphate hydrolase protein, partial [Ascobolus immersus RN42]